MSCPEVWGSGCGKGSGRPGLNRAWPGLAWRVLTSGFLCPQRGLSPTLPVCGHISPRGSSLRTRSARSSLHQLRPPARCLGFRPQGPPGLPPSRVRISSSPPTKARPCPDLGCLLKTMDSPTPFRVCFFLASLQLPWIPSPLGFWASVSLYPLLSATHSTRRWRPPPCSFITQSPGGSCIC